MHTVRVTTIISADIAMLSIQHAFLSVTEALTHSHGLSSAAHCTGNTACYHCGKRHISVRVDPADRPTDRQTRHLNRPTINTDVLPPHNHTRSGLHKSHTRASR